MGDVSNAFFLYLTVVNEDSVYFIFAANVLGTGMTTFLGNRQKSISQFDK